MGRGLGGLGHHLARAPTDTGAERTSENNCAIRSMGRCW